jgi:hypothetical protein
MIRRPASLDSFLSNVALPSDSDGLFPQPARATKVAHLVSQPISTSPDLCKPRSNLSFLLLANEHVGSSGAVSPAAASLRLSRREMLFPDAGNRRETHMSSR